MNILKTKELEYLGRLMGILQELALIQLLDQIDQQVERKIVGITLN